MKKLLPLCLLTAALLMTLPACDIIEDFGDPPTSDLPETATGSSILETHPQNEATAPIGDTLPVPDDDTPILEGSVIDDPIAVPDVFPLSLSYEIVEADYTPGGHMTVSTVIQNITGIDFTYEGSSSQKYPVYTLYRMDEAGTRTVVLSQDYTCDIARHTIAAHESLQHTLTVPLPADLLAGDYLLEIKLDCGEDTDLLAFTIDFQL